MNANILKVKDLSNYAYGLNIEGCRPYYDMPKTCKWYNIVQIIDVPFSSNNIQEILDDAKNNYRTIEESVGIKDSNLNFFCNLINDIKKKYDNEPKILVHIHQPSNNTIIDKLLLDKLNFTIKSGYHNVDIIKDRYNYFFDKEHYKVDYKRVYKKYDVIISLSQCAGFNSKEYPVGTFLIPNNYVNFDIENNIIYTNEHFNNNINKLNHCTNNWCKTKLLVVNDLWIPKDINETIIFFDEQDKKVYDFVIKKTKNFDFSHNHKHALQVAKNSMKILFNDNNFSHLRINKYKKIILYSSLLHDVCDKKYSDIQSLSYNDFENCIHQNLDNSNDIIYIINNISFSKQNNIEYSFIDKNKIIDNKLYDIIDIVRDADRLEALGEIGFERCKYTSIKLGFNDIEDNVIKHSIDKLLKLLPNKYIKTDYGKMIAKKRHNFIIDYLIKKLSEKKIN